MDNNIHPLWSFFDWLLIHKLFLLLLNSVPDKRLNNCLPATDVGTSTVLDDVTSSWQISKNLTMVSLASCVVLLLARRLISVTINLETILVRVLRSLNLSNKLPVDLADGDPGVVTDGPYTLEKEMN